MNVTCDYIVTAIVSKERTVNSIAFFIVITGIVFNTYIIALQFSDLFLFSFFLPVWALLLVFFCISLDYIYLDYILHILVSVHVRYFSYKMLII